MAGAKSNVHSGRDAIGNRAALAPLTDLTAGMRFGNSLFAQCHILKILKLVHLFNAPPTMIERFMTFKSGAFNTHHQRNQIDAKRTILKRNSLTCLIVPSFGFAQPPNGPRLTCGSARRYSQTTGLSIRSIKGVTAGMRKALPSPNLF
jgi:hypothetical protein